ncbi:TPX [Trema orientale]|uniref:TPX n=1 Tax=Trema orientale TaxID=63057 RepID=A0A2P5CG46_TREOI|nr:TPX [Trema orientale]
MDDDEELEEFVREESFVYEEIDMDYEFDAARFYDFTRAETDSEAGEAERWFESARGYPPSRKHFQLLQKKLGNVIDDKSSQHSSVTTDELATKRQKLEAGFLSKVAQLKHHFLLLHKVPKKLPHDGISTNAKPKRVTIPREPDLATSHRAERRRNRINAELGEPIKSNAHAFKARPLNTKILKAPLTLLRKSEPHLPEFQTLAHNGKFCIYRNIKQRFNFSTGKRFQDEPPIHLFSKLCLASEDQQNTRPRSESPLPIKVINVVKERSQRLGGMDFVDCGRHRRIHDLRLYINR